MMWVTMALVAVVLGLILFSSFQQDLPDELAFLKGNPGQAQAVRVDPPVQDGVVAGWFVQSRGAVIELTKKFQAGARVGNYEYDAPVIGLMCNGKELHLRIDAQAPTTGTETTPIKMQGVESTWFKTRTTNLLAPTPGQVAKLLHSAKGPIEFEVSYLDAGLTTITLDPRGLREAALQFPPACRF